MRILLSVLCLALIYSCTPLSYPTNVGREYGNPSMPWMVSHIPNRNMVILEKHSAPHHTMFTRILCFKKYCRQKIGRQKSLKPITFDKFKKKIAKNAKKGMYKNYKADSAKRPVRKKTVIKKDSSQVIAQIMEPEVQAPVLKTDSLITLSEFLFETNSSTLQSEHFSELDSVIGFMIKHPSLVIKITGHTDNTGKESNNKTLSFKRAEVVAEYIIDNGVGLDRVTFEGLGSSRPLMSNTTEAGRRKNRRVEMLMHDRR
ncbi:MAG: OmpA family protein [Cyclobacteriaceae bacterium]|nr:OmpA family protein [Cyclobacteriaceae bacterium]